MLFEVSLRNLSQSDLESVFLPPARRIETNGDVVANSKRFGASFIQLQVRIAGNGDSAHLAADAPIPDPRFAAVRGYSESETSYLRITDQNLAILRCFRAVHQSLGEPAAHVCSMYA